MFGHQNFPHLPWESNPWPLALKASVLTIRLPHFPIFSEFCIGRQFIDFFQLMIFILWLQTLWIFNTIVTETESKVRWTASSEFGTYRICEQRRFRWACASAQSRQNLRCSLIQAVSQEEPSDKKPDPWLLWMAGHVQLKFVMTECSKTQIRLTGLR